MACGFFLTTLHEDQDVQVDGGEISAHRWLCPHRAFAESNDRREALKLMPPTYVSLIELADFSTCHEAQLAIGTRDAIIYEPRVASVEGGLCFLYGGDAGYTAGNVSAPGKRHRATMIDGKMEYIRD